MIVSKPGQETEFKSRGLQLNVGRYDKAKMSGRAQLTLVALAISTYLIGLDFQQVLDDLLVLSSLGRSRTTRHDSW
jgi:hypothetical protein